MGARGSKVSRSLALRPSRTEAILSIRFPIPSTRAKVLTILFWVMVVTMVVEVEPIVEEPVELEVPEPVEEPETVAEVLEPEEIEETAAAEKTVEPVAEDKSFEELFQMDTLRRTSESSEEEDENGLPGDKKKKGKKRKGYTVEYDPDRDATYVKHKHRNDDDWGEW